MSTREAFADATAGVAGSLVAMLAFYPIDVIKINLQAATPNTKEKSIRKKQDIQTIISSMISKHPSALHFLRSLFKGLHYKTAHTTVSSFAYFFLYSWIQSKHKLRVTSAKGNKGKKYQPSTSTRLFLSAVAAMGNVVLTLPLDVLAARSQTGIKSEPDADTEKGTNAEEIASTKRFIYDKVVEEEKKEDHFLEVPYGHSKIVMDNVWKNVNEIDSDGDYDTAEEDFHKPCNEYISDSDDIADDSAHQSSFQECMESEDIYNNTNGHNGCGHNGEPSCEQTQSPSKNSAQMPAPIEVKSPDRSCPKESGSSMTLLNIRKRGDLYKLAELWSGIRPSLLLCSNPSIHFTVFDSLKDIVLSYKARTHKKNSIGLSLGEAFTIGMVAKFAATIATYPLIRAKVMLMVADRERKDVDTDNSLMAILRKMFEDGGMAELYKGCSLQLVHTLLKSALLMMVRERITVTTRYFMLRS